VTGDDAVLVRVRDMTGPEAPPRENGELVFASPWEGRCFGMAIGLVARLGLDWDDFRRRLIAAIATAPDRSYYESWAAALESLVVDHGLVTPQQVVERSAAVEP
jgi:nitrile hydratase accessory protein